MQSSLCGSSVVVIIDFACVVIRAGFKEGGGQTKQLPKGLHKKNSKKIVVVGLGRRHDGSRIVVSVDAYGSGSAVQFSTHMFVHRFGMGSIRRSG